MSTAIQLNIHPIQRIMHMIMTMGWLILQQLPSSVGYSAYYLVYTSNVVCLFTDMPFYFSKPHCLDCDPEYFKNVSGYHPDKNKHESYGRIEPVSQ